jgi:D-alanine-D-alanine ligase
MRIGVLFGGDSEERDVSIASATQVVGALRSLGHVVVLVDTVRGSISRSGETRALSSSVPESPPTAAGLVGIRRSSDQMSISEAVQGSDVVFLALHGGAGENGQFQALLELAGVAFTGSGSLGSALAMDKDVSKRLFSAAGIATPDWVTDSESAADLGFPLIVKPNAQGSTIGLSLVRSAKDLPAAIAAASHYGDVLFERFVPGRELTVGVLDGEALAVGEILLDPETTFSYTQKYQPGAVREVFPAQVSASVADEARRLALAAHITLKLDDYSRSDFRLDEAGNLWLIEVNTLPGLTATSLLPQSAAAVGIDYPTLCERISQLAYQRAEGNRRRRP